VVVAALVAAGLVVAAQGYAFAGPGGKDGDTRPVFAGDTGAGAVPGGFASWDELMAVQERLDAKAEAITEARDQNFAGIEVAAERRALTVYWKGGQPAPAAASAIEAARSGDDTVAVVAAPYSEDELMAESAKIAGQDGVSAVAPKVDGSGLLVSTVPGHLGIFFSPIPLTRDEARPVLASRADDSPPYRGGAKWGGCTSGFAISIKGSTRMLSAGHCADNGEIAEDGGGQTMGTVNGDSDSYDRLFIDTKSAGRIYNGAVNPDGSGNGEYSSPVAGASASFVGDYICSSGAYSGTRCGSQVKAVNQTINVGYPIYQTVRAEKLDRTAAIGNGDSGGPSFAVSSDRKKVIAKGTHTAIDTAAARPCTGEPSVVHGRTCSYRFYYVDVTKSLKAYGAKIVTD
jgi:hypothetical protein